MIECDCSSTDYDDNWCYSERIRGARKQHWCCECSEAIMPGQHYEDASGIDAGGDPFRQRTCLPCSRIRAHYCPRGWIFGELRQQFEYCVGFDYVTGPDLDDDDPRYDGDVPLMQSEKP